MTTQALVLTAFIIVVLTTLSFIVARIMLERSVETQLSSVATIAEDSLERTLQNHHERASLIAARADVKEIASGSFDPGILGRLLVDLQREQSAIIGIGVYNKEGNTLATAGSSVELPEEAKKTSFYRPVITNVGWDLYDVFTPVWGMDGKKIGFVSLRYDISPALESLLAVVPSLGDTAKVVLVLHRNSEVQLIHPSLKKADSYVLSLGNAADSRSAGLALVKSLDGQEAVARTHDYRGIDSLVAYRYLPTLGWGLAIQVERKEALEDVRRLAIAHAAIGTLLLLLAGVIASLLARQVTEPLRQLTEHVRQLRPGAWNIRRSVHTDDEVEILDTVVVDMASRLKTVYEEQKVTIAERTEELKKQYVLDRAILQSIEYGVVTVDRKGLIIGANPAAINMLLESRNDLLQKDITEVIRVCGHRGDVLEGGHPVKNCLQSGKAVQSPVNAHFNIRRHDETLLPVMYAVSPLVENGAIFGAIIVFQDITEERRLDYLKSEFISLASHQLRTPLSALRWYVELFADDAKHLNADQKGYLMQMENSVNRMVALLTSLLHAAHLEGDNLEPEVTKVDVAQVMNELYADCKMLSHEAGIQCKLTLPKKSLILETDETLLRIVLQNLMNNAVKYSPVKSGKHIHFAVQQSKKDIVFIVSDEGWGIPKQEQSRIFQKFFRAKNIRKHDTDGNGLGLYITRSIVDRLGGAITFESEENKGTTFTVTLPASHAVKKNT